MPAHRFIQRRDFLEQVEDLIEKLDPTRTQTKQPTITATNDENNFPVRAEAEDEKDGITFTLNPSQSASNEEAPGLSGAPAEIQAPATTSTVETALALATGEASPAASDAFANLGGASSIPSATGSASGSNASKDNASAEESGSGSAGAKAGIAFGVIAGALLLGILIFLLFTRRKRKNQEERRKRRSDREKHARTESGRTVPPPQTPKSDRPVTRFFHSNWRLDKPLPNPEEGLVPPPAALLPPTRRSSAMTTWGRPASGHDTNPSNPFGNHASTANPFGSHAEVLHPEDRSRSPSPISVNDALPRSHLDGTDASIIPAPLARKASLRKDGLKQLELSMAPPPKIGVAVPGSPALTDYSVASSALTTTTFGAGAFAAETTPVHRVQQDFDPTMDDEMPLRAGELVRMLHEFDDGWALCIRLDKSQQGVAPRACLSSRPLKPRTPTMGSRVA